MKQPRVAVLEPAEEADIDDPSRRAGWFMFQREYPFVTVPDDARREAWEDVTQSGLFQLGPPVEAWTSIGPTPSIPFYATRGITSGRINTIAISPRNTQIILVGGSTGGIWRSSDGGANFIAVSDSHVDMSVGSIAFAKSDPNIVYAAMGDAHTGRYLGTGILKSTDAGVTWTRISGSTFPSPGTIHKVDVDPTNPNRVYVAALSYLAGNVRIASGFYISSDGGVTWTRRLVGISRDLLIDPLNPNTLYVAMSRLDPSGSGPAGIYRSTDAGVTFTRIYTTPYDAGTSDIRVAMSPANPQTIYVYTGGFIGSTRDYRVVVSTDGGVTWNSLGASFDTGQFGYNTYLAVDPTDANTVYVGSRDIFKSTDGGASWTNLNNNHTLNNGVWALTYSRSNLHVDQQCIAFSPNDPNTIFVGNDGGIWKTTDAGNTFTPLNASLSLTQFYSVSMHPTDATLFFGGAQDNSTQRRLGDSQQWKAITTGDGGPTVIDALDPNFIFTVITGNILRSSNRGVTLDRNVGTAGTFGEPSSGPRIAFIPPLVGNGVDSTLYFGTWRLFVSTDRGTTWTAPANTTDLTKGSSDVINTIAVARANPNVIYTGSLQGKAMTSTDGGLTWVDITTGIPNRSITSIVVDSINPALVYLTVSGYATSHVFRSTDSGSSWTDVSGNLPDIPVNALLIDPISPDTIYVGTDIGVFRSISGGNVWQSFNGGMPPVIVTSFAAQPSGRIRIGTYGRGAYELSTGEFNATLSAGQVFSRTSPGLGSLSVGYGELSGTLAQPVALGNFSFVQNGSLVTEVGIPAATTVRNARLFVDYSAVTNSGIAIVNPGEAAITVNVVVRDQSGGSGGSTTFDLGPKSQTARFVSELVPGLPNPFLGTLTLSSNDPFAAINLSSAFNRRGETIYSALPLADLDQVPKETSLVFPQVADGDGISTQILLMNPSSITAGSGTIALFDDNGSPVAFDFGSSQGAQSVLNYTIAPNGMVKFSSRGITSPVRVGYAVLTSTAGPTPIGSGIFSVTEAGALVSQAGVPATPKTTSARLFIDRATTPLTRNTGIALVNTETVQAVITASLVGIDGTARNTSITLGPKQHTSKFISELMTNLPVDFQGALTLTSSVPVSPLTLRLTVNQRGETIFSTLPVADLRNPPVGPMFIPQIVDGEGYQTQIILVNTGGGSGTVRINFFDQAGNRVTMR